ncbi:MAG TPA: hypothetical protein PK413_17985, partial [Thermoanaerobaculia bacterium]|nr:hypothetical protein [Thermoanaerobaculia bacterium]
MIGAVLVDGDLRLAGVGTVTDIVGDRLFAFGHQFFGVGSVSIPMALGDVITVMPSLDSSFKLANLGRTIGSFDQDRVTGIAGRIGGQAPTTALEVHLEGEAERTLSMGLANLRNYLPSLVGTAALGSLETVIKGSGHQTVDVEARFDLKGQAPLAVRQSFDGENSALDVATYLLSIADLLVNNSFETLNLERVEVRLRTREGEQLASLDKAWADRSRARAGERLKLWAEFRSVRGASFRKSLEITLPADLPPGRYQLSLGDGPSQDAARLAAEPVEPRNVSELLAAARKLSSRTELVVLGSRSSRGLAFGGQPLPQQIYDAMHAGDERSHEVVDVDLAGRPEGQQGQHEHRHPSSARSDPSPATGHGHGAATEVADGRPHQQATPEVDQSGHPGLRGVVLDGADAEDGGRGGEERGHQRRDDAIVE